jgi:hypothetical protein
MVLHKNCPTDSVALCKYYERSGSGLFPFLGDLHFRDATCKEEMVEEVETVAAG